MSITVISNNIENKDLLKIRWNLYLNYNEYNETFDHNINPFTQYDKEENWDDWDEDYFICRDFTGFKMTNEWRIDIANTFYNINDVNEILNMPLLIFGSWIKFYLEGFADNNKKIYKIELQGKIFNIPQNIEIFVIDFDNLVCWDNKNNYCKIIIYFDKLYDFNFNNPNNIIQFSYSNEKRNITSINGIIFDIDIDKLYGDIKLLKNLNLHINKFAFIDQREIEDEQIYEQIPCNIDTCLSIQHPIITKNKLKKIVHRWM